jgi:hypothetical protein
VQQGTKAVLALSWTLRTYFPVASVRDKSAFLAVRVARSVPDAPAPTVPEAVVAVRPPPLAGVSESHRTSRITPLRLLLALSLTWKVMRLTLDDPAAALMATLAGYAGTATVELDVTAVEVQRGVDERRASCR